MTAPLRSGDKCRPVRENPPAGPIAGRFLRVPLLPGGLSYSGCVCRGVQKTLLRKGGFGWISY